MSKHSRKYVETMKSLEEKEQLLREEIEKESGSFESNLMRTLKIGGIVLGAAGLGYMLFRAINSSEDSEETENVKNKKSVDTVEDGFLAKMIDRTSEIAIAGLVKALSSYLTKEGKS